uniref:C3H1-type domain-containing protein n=1 Tax=Mesocestoides corti TaxID=53468 RepID=A0A5K3EJ19_MESCO
MFHGNRGPNVAMGPLGGYLPSTQSQPLYAPLPPPPPPPSLPSMQTQSAVVPLGAQPPPKAYPGLEIPLKSSQLSPNTTTYQQATCTLPPVPVTAASAIPNSAVSLAALATAVAASNVPVRDSTWLKMRVCSAFLKEVMMGGNIPEKEKCPFTSESCPLAHPQPNVRIENEHVTVCFDYIKRNECRHTNCKYFHPPKHQTEAVLKRGDITKKNSASHGSHSATTSLAGLYWPGATAQSPLMLNPAAQANPAAAIAMYAAMRGATPTSGFYPAMAPATSIYSAVPDPTSLASLVAGFYQLPTSTATVPTSVYNPVDALLLMPS